MQKSRLQELRLEKAGCVHNCWPNVSVKTVLCFKERMFSSETSESSVESCARIVFHKMANVSNLGKGLPRAVVGECVRYL